MIKNTFIINKKGFSLLEVSLAIVVIAVLISAMTPVAIKQIEFKAGEKTAHEISIIQEAARKYYVDNNAWPNTIFDLQTGGYLNASWVTTNPWGFPYNVTNNTNTFSVINQVPTQMVGFMTLSLPSTSNLLGVVTSTIPIPGAATGFNFSNFGTIYYGSLANLPAPWQLCDGTNGTPDLQSRFAVGAGTTYNLNDIGGQTQVTLSIFNIPPHTHDLTMYTGGTPGFASHPGNGTASANGAVATTLSAGGGQPFNILPPYRAVYYVCHP